MKNHPRLIDKALVAALLLSCMPELLTGLTDHLPHDTSAPIALIAPAEDATKDTPADEL